MTILHILRSQANSVLSEITEAGFSPSEFNWEYIHSPAYGATMPQILASRLTYGSSGFFFVFDTYEGRFVAKWSPDNEKLNGGTDAGNWKSLLQLFRAWLVYLRREVESPDMWGAIAQEREILDSASTGDDNTPFTSSEKEYVRSAVDEIREYLITAHNFDRAIVEPQLKYLVESSERVGRKDWKNLLFATMVSLVISAYAPPETIREIFRFVGTVLRNLLHQPILLQ